MGRNKLSHTWSTLPHACTQGCSMRQQPRVQPKGLTLLLCSLWGHLYLWRRDAKSHGWDTSGAEQSQSRVWPQLVVFSKSRICPVLWACAASLGPPVCCVMCRDKSICSLQAVLSILETSVHEWLICVSGNELDWHKNTGKAASQMLLLWFGCVFREYLAYVALFGLLQIIPAQRPGVCELMAWDAVGYFQP